MDFIERTTTALKRIRRITGQIDERVILFFIRIIFALKARARGLENFRKGGYIIAVHPHSDVMETAVVFELIRRRLGDRGFRFFIIYWLPMFAEILFGNQFIKRFNFIIREKVQKWRWYDEAVGCLEGGCPVVLYMTSFLANYKEGKLGMGAARLAVETQAPVIPVLVQSSLRNGIINFLIYLFNPFEKINITVGEPFRVDGLTRKEGAEYITTKIEELKNSSV